MDYFEIEIEGRIHPVAKKEFSPYEKSLGKSGYEITIWDSTIDAAKLVVSNYGIEYLKISTRDLNFIKGPEFRNIKGVKINGEIKDITPLEQLKKMEYLELFNSKKSKLDFGNLQALKFLNCEFSNKYKNLSRLNNLENLYLIKYPAPNLEEFSSFHKLKRLHMTFSKCESLTGIGSLNNLEKITLEDCKKLTSLNGLKENKSLTELIIVDCKNLNDYSSVKNLYKNCLVLIDGNQLGDLNQTVNDKIEDLIADLDEIGSDEEVKIAVKKALENLRENITAINWKRELKKCVAHLNKVENGIYTEEREVIISTIGYILVDFDSDELASIIDEHRNW